MLYGSKKFIWGWKNMKKKSYRFEMTRRFQINPLNHSAIRSTAHALQVDECRDDLSLCADKIECTQTKLQVTERSWHDYVITSAGPHAGQILLLSGHIHKHTPYRHQPRDVGN